MRMKFLLVIIIFLVVFMIGIKLDASSNEEILLENITENEMELSIQEERLILAQLKKEAGLQKGKFRIEELIVTAYAPFDNKSGMCNDGNPNLTSTGSKPAYGTVAVNPKKFPYGTVFYIEGYGFGTALDTGGAMRKNPNKIDVYMDTYEEAMNWGVRKIKVYIYE